MKNNQGATLRRDEAKNRPKQILSRHAEAFSKAQIMLSNMLAPKAVNVALARWDRDPYFQGIVCGFRRALLDAHLERFPEHNRRLAGPPSNAAIAEEWAAMQPLSRPRAERAKFLKGFAEGTKRGDEFDDWKLEEEANLRIFLLGGKHRPMKQLKAGDWLSVNSRKAVLLHFLKHRKDVEKMRSMEEFYDWLCGALGQDIVGSLKRTRKLFGDALGLRLNRRGRSRGT